LKVRQGEKKKRILVQKREIPSEKVRRLRGKRHRRRKEHWHAKGAGAFRKRGEKKPLAPSGGSDRPRGGKNRLSQGGENPEGLPWKKKRRMCSHGPGESTAMRGGKRKNGSVGDKGVIFSRREKGG